MDYKLLSLIEHANRVSLLQATSETNVPVEWLHDPTHILIVTLGNQDLELYPEFDNE